MVNANANINGKQSDGLGPSSRIWQPDTIKEAWEIKQTYQEKAQYIAAGTLIQLQREQGTPLKSNLIRLDHFGSLQGCKWITENNAVKLEIGALTTLKQLQMNNDTLDYFEILVESAGEVASPAVRNRATIGGNVAYRVGDTIPALLALGAQVRWFDDGEVYVDDLSVYLDLQSEQDTALLMAILLPQSQVSAQSYTFYQKVGRRESFIPSLVTVALSIGLSLEGRVEYIYIAAGGGATKPIRLTAVEAIVTQNMLDTQLLGTVHQKIQDVFKPVSDPFVSPEYRKIVVANLIVSELEKLIDLQREDNE
ncbi:MULTISPECIES: xanthine dehydrogenase family protein subunit M [Paraliobacillus]|uniref:FAD binding domain-containing protein n=1 Tax=Paraliobacillus TaxID=200903 RepID=UPI000DD4AE17|nr:MULTISPECIES: FAD binding domain-containing protein [Paraliobacillus]